jgi:hypothetical protein
MHSKMPMSFLLPFLIASNHSFQALWSRMELKICLSAM